MNTITTSAPVPSKAVFLGRPFPRILTRSAFLAVLVPFLAVLFPSGDNPRDAQAAATGAAKADFFVSPQGDDRWSGVLPEPNPSRTDGPLATAERRGTPSGSFAPPSNSIGPCGSSSAGVSTAARSHWCCGGGCRQGRQPDDL